MSIVLAAAEPFNANSLTGIESNIQGFRFAGMKIGDVLSIGVWSPVAIVFYIVGAYFLINTLIAGFTLMTSAGVPANIQSAKTRLMNSLIGLLIVFTAYWIVRIIGAVLGLDGIAGVFGGAN